MRALARWCFTHKFVVIGIWVAALIVIGGLNASAGSGYTDSFSLPGTESTTALNLLTDNFNAESTDTNQVVFGAADAPRRRRRRGSSGRSRRSRRAPTSSASTA